MCGGVHGGCAFVFVFLMGKGRGGRTVFLNGAEVELGKWPRLSLFLDLDLDLDLSLLFGLGLVGWWGFIRKCRV